MRRESMLPLSGQGNDTYVAVPGRHQIGTETQFNSRTRAVSANYFDVMGIPIVRGRRFAAADRTGAAQVVIINQPFADAILTDEDPVSALREG